MLKIVIVLVVLAVSVTQSTPSTSREAQCYLCRHFAAQLIDVVYHDTVSRDVTVHRVIEKLERKYVSTRSASTSTASPRREFPPNVYGLNGTDYVDFISHLTSNRKHDTLLRDLILNPPSSRRISFSAIQDIFHKSLCQSALGVCDDYDDRSDL